MPPFPIAKVVVAPVFVPALYGYFRVEQALSNVPSYLAQANKMLCFIARIEQTTRINCYNATMCIAESL